ncbi:hypothetical protein MRB53_001577 [Persea americana]|uniref:Uncharacterized protein n=1 Tax=Persea americana TaxID=3435 RepID=A0ACC2MT28_PERAE|nr:hypothetical protein MRB53_001577 [Persea americana]
MPVLTLPISPPGELLPRLLSSLAITILILIFIFQSISSCFRFLAKTQFIWLLDPPFHPSNTASSHLSMPTYDPREEPGVVQRKPVEDSEELVQCAVCLCNIEEGEEMRELRCEHLFHRGCLDAWLGYRHLTCPICREALPGKLPDGTEGAEMEEIMSQYSFLVGSNAHNTSIHDSSLSLY